MGLALAREHRPDGVLVFAGDGRGEVLLGQLKQHPETRHRPVFVVGPARRPARRPARGRGSALLGRGRRGRRRPGARRARRTARPAVKRLALVRNGSELDPTTMALLGAGDDVDVVEVPEADALTALRADGTDCAVLPLGTTPTGCSRCSSRRRATSGCGSCR